MNIITYVIPTFKLLTNIPMNPKFTIVKSDVGVEMIINVGTFAMNQLMIRSDTREFPKEKSDQLLTFANSVTDMKETDVVDFVWLLPFVSFHVTNDYINIRTASNSYSLCCNEISRASFASALMDFHQSIADLIEECEKMCSARLDGVMYYKDPHVG